MAKKDGRVIALQFDAVTLVGRTTSSLSASADMLDATTADSAGWKEYITGEKGATISVGALYDPEAAEGFSQALLNLTAGTQVAFKWGDVVTGGKYIEGNALVNSVDINGDKNTMMAYTISLQVTGIFEEKTVV